MFLKETLKFRVDADLLSWVQSRCLSFFGSDEISDPSIMNQNMVDEPVSKKLCQFQSRNRIAFNKIFRSLAYLLDEHFVFLLMDLVFTIPDMKHNCFLIHKMCSGIDDERLEDIHDDPSASTLFCCIDQFPCELKQLLVLFVDLRNTDLKPFFPSDMIHNTNLLGIGFLGSVIHAHGHRLSAKKKIRT